jgi:hypothetical protein
MKTLFTYEFEDDYEDVVKPFAQYREFADVPEKTTENALHWLMAIHATKAKSLQEQFEQIPVPLWTGKLLTFVVTYEPTVLSLIPPQHAPNYQSLCVLASRKDYRMAGAFHESFRTPETIERMLDERKDFHRSYQEFPWIADTMTPELMEKATRSSLAFMFMLPSALVSDAALNIRFGAGLDCHFLARREGRLDLPARLLRNGWWPRVADPACKWEEDVSLIRFIERPESLQCALDLMLEGDDRGLRPLYMAYVMSHPLEDVIAHINHRKYIPYIIEMYKEEELRPYLKTNRHLKAGMLESALGL